MEIMGIKFETLNVPLKRRLETLAAGSWIILMLYGHHVMILITIYILFFTNYWFLMVLYLIWIYLVDYTNCSNGGRSSKWLRGIVWLKYLKDYFSFKVEKAEGFELDPKRNYLFCSFPHGIFPGGAFIAFVSSCGGLDKLFPHHTSHLITLTQFFFTPFLRELSSVWGVCSSSVYILNWLLTYPGGGKIVALVVGGIAESIHSRPGNNTLVLKNRKGFVKLALKNGTPLVPVFTFGETDLFDQFDNSEGTLLRRFQEFTRKYTRIAQVIPKGRGFCNFGVMPQRRPLTMIIGKPLEIQKVINPSQEEIDSIHTEFIDQLIKLFDENKHKYIQNPEEAKLIIV